MELKFDEFLSGGNPYLTKISLIKYIYDYLISISKLMIKLQIPLNWFTPNGIKVTQSYMKTEAKRVSIKLGQKSKVLVVRKTTGFVDTAKQAQAIIPNMIHSLDATHLINIINNLHLLL